MVRLVYSFVLAATALFAQPNPPFDQWLKAGDQGGIRWSMRILPPTLSEYQRLQFSIWIDVRASEFVKRDGRGQIRFFLEIRDHDQRAYRKQQPLLLRGRENPTESFSLRFSERGCILPGDYEVAGIVYDAESNAHSVKRTKLHIPEIRRDPLRGAWRDLPSVQFSNCSPTNSARLFLPLSNEKPVRIEVVLNATDNRTKMAVSGLPLVGKLITWLQVISEIEVLNGSMNVTLFDLERRKIGFSQDNVDKLNLKGVNAALKENDPYKVDFAALEDSKEDAQFFVSQIRRLLERNESAQVERVMIVLSGPKRFPKGVDLQPIEATPQPGSRVFYIRGHQFPGATDASTPSNSDSLEETLRPLHPRLFDVMSAIEFRHALAEIIKEIADKK